jgi:hypothetical protein
MRLTPDHQTTIGKGSIVIALSMAVAGCDLGIGGLGEVAGCAAVSVGRGLGGIALAFGAPAQKALEDDSGEVQPSVIGTCFTDDCKPRIAQVGTQIELQVDVTDLALRRGIELGAARTELISTDPEVIKVANGEPMVDPCAADRLFVRTGLKFNKEGQASLQVQHGGLALASFSFEVAQAASLKVTAQPGNSPTSVEIDDGELSTRSVRGGLRAGMSLRVQAFAADGREMLLDNSVLGIIEDPTVARFSLSTDPKTARGVKVWVSFLVEGSTTLRVESGELTTTIVLHTDPSLPSPPLSAAGSASPLP